MLKKNSEVRKTKVLLSHLPVGSYRQTDICHWYTNAAAQHRNHISHMAQWAEQSKPAMSATRPTFVSEKLPSHQAHVPASRETAVTVIGTTGPSSLHFSAGK